MPDAADQRIAALEHEVRNLKMQLAHSRRQFVAPPRRDEPTVRVLHPVRQVALPTDAEFEQLIGIVFSRYPRLRSDDEVFGAQFRAAFQYLLRTGRRDKLDMEHSVSWWCDTAIVWLREHQLAAPVSLGGVAFTAALVAHGDIPHTLSDSFPFDLSFGLQFGGGGRPSSNKWREVLVTGALLEPSPSPHPTAPRSPARQIAIGHSDSSFSSASKGAVN